MGAEKSAGGLHDGHRARIKERYIQTGLESFAEHQILELLLFYAYPRCDTNETAHKMINQYGSLAALLEADPRDIAEQCKVSVNVAVLISLVLPIARKYTESKKPKGQLLDSVRKAGAYATGLFVGRRDECFYMICLDVRHALLCNVLIGKGDLAEVSIYPRQLVVEAIRARASCVILAHNHPSGEVKPSANDVASTELIRKAFETLGIELLDHLIVAGEKYYSFSEKGRLSTVY